MSLIDDIFHHCMSGSSSGELTAQNVSMYHSSPFTVYCQKFVSKDKRDSRSPYRELLQERGKEHEKRFIEREYPGLAGISPENPEKGFFSLLKEMARGAEVICGLPLFFLPKNMQGRIDVLEKRKNHPSVFGDYHYVVKEIKLAKNIRQGHIIQGAFYTYIISEIQRYLPKNFFIVNRDYQKQEYRYEEYEETLMAAVEGAQSILNGGEIPTPTYNGCEWPWQKYCNHEALRSRDVSIVNHVGPRTKAKMVAKGFAKIWDIASANVDDLQQTLGIGKSVAKKLKRSAQAIQKGEPLRIEGAALKFPERTTEIFLDLEGIDQQGQNNELVQVDYLIGVLLRKKNKEKYQSFLAQKLQDEGRMFHDFMAFIKEQRAYAIYHWHNYERWHIKQLAERHGLREEAETLLLPYMIDLHKVATRVFVFPTYGTGLKDIADFLGFKWRHDDINALDAIAYYLKYQNNPKDFEDKLRAIVDYNEDDCIATKVVKDWLQERAVEQ